MASSLNTSPLKATVLSLGCLWHIQVSNFQLGNKICSSGERFWLDLEMVEVEEAMAERQKEKRGQVQSSKEPQHLLGEFER